VTKGSFAPSKHNSDHRPIGTTVRKKLYRFEALILPSLTRQHLTLPFSHKRCWRTSLPPPQPLQQASVTLQGHWNKSSQSCPPSTLVRSSQRRRC